MSGLWVNSCSCAAPTQACAGMTCENKHRGLFLVPHAALKSTGIERLLWRVWCTALSIPVPLSKEDELPLQEQYLERELVPSWLEEQSCLPSPGRTGVHCSRVTWGLCVRAVFPSSTLLLQRGAKECVCECGAFFPTLALTA